MGETEESELLTVAEVARILRVDDTTVRRWAKDGTIESVILPSRGRQIYRIKRETLKRVLGENDESTTSHNAQQPNSQDH